MRHREARGERSCRELVDELEAKAAAAAAGTTTERPAGHSDSATRLPASLVASLEWTHALHRSALFRFHWFRPRRAAARGDAAEQAPIDFVGELRPQSARWRELLARLERGAHTTAEMRELAPLLASESEVSLDRSRVAQDGSRHV